MSINKKARRLRIQPLAGQRQSQVRFWRVYFERIGRFVKEKIKNGKRFLVRRGEAGSIGSHACEIVNSVEKIIGKIYKSPEIIPAISRIFKLAYG